MKGSSNSSETPFNGIRELSHRFIYTKVFILNSLVSAVFKFGRNHNMINFLFSIGFLNIQIVSYKNLIFTNHFTEDAYHYNCDISYHCLSAVYL